MLKAVHLLYFSPTGNSKKYAKLVAEGLGLPVTEHDLSSPGWADKNPIISGQHNEKVQFKQDDLVIFSAPVFAGRIPPLAARRFKLFAGAGGPAIVLASYGNRDYDDALLELADIAKELGFKLAGAAAVIGRHSLLPHLAAERPYQNDRAEALAFAQKCLHKLQNTPLTQLPDISIKGNRPYKELPPASPWEIYATDDCNNCQSCVLLCPVGAIPADNPKITGDVCFTCGRCLAICPQQARKIPEPVFKMMRERIDPMAAGHKKSDWLV